MLAPAPVVEEGEHLRCECRDVSIGASHGLAGRKHVCSAPAKAVYDNPFAADAGVPDQESMPLFISFGCYGEPHRVTALMQSSARP